MELVTIDDVTVNSYNDNGIDVLVTVKGSDGLKRSCSVDVPLFTAQKLVRFFLDSGVEVCSYWTDCVDREARIDPRIVRGKRSPR